MKEVALDTLKSAILKPGIEKYLLPLTDFRGKTLGGVHRMWNFSINMMLHEATHADATQRLWGNEAYSQLCGTTVKASSITIGVFTGALMAKPYVAHNHPGLLEYMRHVARHIIDPRKTWHVQRDTWKPYAGDNPYPFLVHEAKRPVDPLVALIAKAVPKHLDREMKADLCQDLAVAILCGDLKKEDIQDGIRKFLPKLWKVNPGSKWADFSLNTVIPGTDGLENIDLLASDVERF